MIMRKTTKIATYISKIATGCDANDLSSHRADAGRPPAGKIAGIRPRLSLYGHRLPVRRLFRPLRGLALARHLGDQRLCFRRAQDLHAARRVSRQAGRRRAGQRQRAAPQRGLRGARGVRVQTHMFDRSLVAAAELPLRRYVAPVVECALLDALPLSRGEPRQRAVLEALDRAFMPRGKRTATNWKSAGSSTAPGRAYTRWRSPSSARGSPCRGWRRRG